MSESDETSPLLLSRGHPDQVDEGQNPPEKSYTSLIIPLSVGYFLSSLDTTIVASSYAAIGSDLDQLHNASWVATAYLLTHTSLQPFYGKLSDVFGRKNTLLFCYTVFGIGCLLCGLSRNMTELVLSRALSGVGGGGIQTTVNIILSDVIPIRSRGTYQGLINIALAVGNSTGASLGGIFADTVGWRWSFYFQVPIVAIAIISLTHGITLPKYSESSDLKTKLKRLDFFGAITLTSAICSLLLGLERAGNVAWNDNYTKFFVASCVLFIVLFIIIEAKISVEPLAPRRIMANASLMVCYVLNFCQMAVVYGHLFYVTLYMQAVLEMSASETSPWLVANIVFAVASSISTGFIIKGTGRYYFLSIASYLALALGALFATLTAGIFIRSSIGVGIGLIISNIGNGSGSSITLISIASNVSSEDQAIATSISFLFRGLGAIFGVSFGTSLLQGTLRSILRQRFTDEGAEEIINRVRESLKYIDTLEPTTAVIVRDAYEQALQVAFGFLLFLGAFAFVSSFFINARPLDSKK